jgi:hypothetical protein
MVEGTQGFASQGRVEEDEHSYHAPPDPRLAALAGHLSLIEQIGEDLARAKNRRESCCDPHARCYWQAEIARLRAIAKAELAALTSAINRHHHLARRLALVASVAGIGPRTAIAIVLRMRVDFRMSSPLTSKLTSPDFLQRSRHEPAALQKCYRDCYIGCYRNLDTPQVKILK